MIFQNKRKNRENFGQEIFFGNISRKVKNVTRLLLVFCTIFIFSFLYFLFKDIGFETLVEQIKKFDFQNSTLGNSILPLCLKSFLISSTVTLSFHLLTMIIGKISNQEQILDGGKELDIEKLNKAIFKWIKKWIQREKEEIGKGKFDFFESCDLGAASKEQKLKHFFGQYLTVGDEKKLYFPEEFCTQHIAIEGATGTGKTVLINSMLDQIRNHNDTQVCILDFNGQFYSRFGRKDDLILSINDKRSVKWNPWCEKIAPEKLASGLIEEDPKDKFFAPAAQSLFCDLMTLNHGIESFWKDLSLPAEELFEKLKNFGLPSSNDFASKSGGQGAGVRRTMTLKLDALKHLNHWTGHKEDFSIIDWARNGSKNWLFLIVREEDREKSTPWLRLWMHLVISGMMMRNEKERNNATWLIADEIPLLGKLPSLKDGITNGRKYNLRVVLGYQTEGQLDQVYESESSGIKNSTRTKFYFNPGDAQSAMRSAMNLGKKEIYDPLESESYGNEKFWQSSVSNTNQIREKFVIHPEKLRLLDKTECYLRLPIFNPVFLRTALKNYPSINKAHDCEDPPRIFGVPV